MKNFAERHAFVIALLELTVLGSAGAYLGNTSNHFWFLLIVFAGLLYLLIFFFQIINKEWVCTICGKSESAGRHKFCSECGGVMHAVKKEKILCPRGHRVEKHDKFCPKCGTSLNG